MITTSPYFKYLPIVNFFIASSALVFQTTVLFPWHHQLDSDFKDLEEKHKAKLHEYHLLKVRRLDEIDKKVSLLLDHMLKEEAYDSSHSQQPHPHPTTTLLAHIEEVE